MKPYIKNAHVFWGLDDYEASECTITGRPTNEWHHLKPRGMGGSKHRDTPINLAPVCREIHDKAEHDPAFNRHLIKRHVTNIINHIARFHNLRIEFKIYDVLQEGKDQWEL